MYFDEEKLQQTYGEIKGALNTKAKFEDLQLIISEYEKFGGHGDIEKVADTLYFQINEDIAIRFATKVYEDLNIEKLGDLYNSIEDLSEVEILEFPHDKGVNIDEMNIDGAKLLCLAFLDTSEEYKAVFSDNKFKTEDFLEYFQQSEKSKDMKEKLEDEFDEKALTKAQKLSNDIESENFVYKAPTTRTSRTKL